MRRTRAVILLVVFALMAAGGLELLAKALIYGFVRLAVLVAGG